MNNHLSIEARVQIMGFIKTREEKEQRLKDRQKLKLDIQRRNESRKKAIQEQNKKNEEIRKLYRERVNEERRLREIRNSEDQESSIYRVNGD